MNRSGQLTGYKLVPGSNCLPLAGPEAKFMRRAAFLKHNLWVTPYARGEDFPGGEFPNQNPRVGEGLASWVKQNRSLEETNIVLWLVSSIKHSVLNFFISFSKIKLSYPPQKIASTYTKLASYQSGFICSFSLYIILKILLLQNL